MVAATAVASIPRRIYLERAEEAVNEFIVEGTAHGKPVRVRVFAQNSHHAQQTAKQQTGDLHMSFRLVKQL